MLYNLNLQFFSTKFCYYHDSNNLSTVCTLCVHSCTYCGRDKTRSDSLHADTPSPNTTIFDGAMAT